MIHISDLHLGAIRSGGTTPATAWQLRQNLLRDYLQLLDDIDEDLLINGDLFDTANIPMKDLLDAWAITTHWLLKGHKLYLSAGNHDLSKNSTVLSSFQFFCQLLQTQFPKKVVAIFEPMIIQTNCYVIPHLPNQELFDMALAAVPTCKYLFLHANYDNKFAERADHSLNLTPAQAEAAPCEWIILGHEHQRRSEGKVLVVGNQMPSSVADCLGNTAKFMLRCSDDKVEWLQTWEREGSFVQLDWEELADTGAEFVRVVGEAAAAEDAARVVANISKFRAKSKALVITNAVSIAGVDDAEQLQVSLEQVKAFDVMEALMRYLDDREQGVVKKLLEEHS